MSPRGSRPWELVVIGGGTAGIVAAKTASGLGARVLLVERERTGGDCLWTGCVPSKALIASADAAASARSASRLGIEVGGVTTDFASVMSHVRATIAAIAPVDSPEALQSAGVEVLLGTAAFSGPRSIVVDGRTVTFQRAVLATGASPMVPPIPGLADVDHLTSDTLWSLTQLPRRLVVLGGGSIGCELGQAFARLGSDVTIVEAARRVLPREDEDASAAVARSLERDGLRVHVGRPVVEVEPDGGAAGSLIVGNAGDRTAVPFDQLLVALGRSPRTDALGLDRAGIALDPRRFVVVDRGLRTSNPRVWAAGDLTGHPQFTHLAGMHASVAASNAVLGLRRRAEVRAVPRVTFTDPEVAAVGRPTGRGELDAATTVVTRRHEHVDRALAESSTDGFARLALDRRGRVVGATTVGPRAGETLAELTLAVKAAMSTRDLAGTTHAYPTYSDGPWNAAIDDVRDRLARPPAARAARALLALRRLLAR